MMKKTLGQQLLDTHEEHQKNILTPIESGDLANEAGKSYMKGLWKAIDNHAKLKLDKIWIMAKAEKEHFAHRAIKIMFGVMDKPLRYMRESMDLWEYDYKNNKLKLLWSLPHRSGMKNFLRAPDKYSKDLIKWINMYIDQENINLKDSKTQIIS